MPIARARCRRLLLPLLVVVGALQPLHAQAPAAPAPALDFTVYRERVEPAFVAPRPGLMPCVECHAGRVGTRFRLEPLADGATRWTEEQTRKNCAAVSTLVVPGTPMGSRLLLHPLARDAGGDGFHGGGKHWASQADAEWQV